MTEYRHGTEKCCDACHQILPRELSEVISCSGDMYQFARKMGWCEPKQEVFYAVTLSTCNKIIRYDEIARGGINTVHVHPSDVMRPALLCSGASIIVAHNHPSGEPNPSPEDRLLTERISNACSLMGLRLLDHLIVANGTYYSFSDAGEA